MSIVNKFKDFIGLNDEYEEEDDDMEYGYSDEYEEEKKLEKNAANRERYS